MRLADLDGQRVVVWGWGNEGRAARQLLGRHARPASVVVIDDQEQASDPDVRRGADSRAALAEATVVVKSPGVPLRIARAAGKPVTGGTQLWFASTGGARTIGVTGSKGKSTTSSLIAHLLDSVGVAAVLAGNVGRALLDLLDADLVDPAPNSARWNVLELSSFQSAEVEHSPEIGVLTALFPEHLDWHGSIEQYYSDKINLFRHRPDITTIVNTDNPNIAARLAQHPGELRNIVAYGTPDGLHPVEDRICDVGGAVVASLAGYALVGRHNAINVCGALTAVRAAGVDLTDRRIQAGLDSFRPLDYRLQNLGMLEGRLVIDDGLSTAPEAAIAAISAYPDRPIGLIVGGHDRGLDYSELAAAIAARTQPTWVFGVPDNGPRIIACIREHQARPDGLPSSERAHLETFEDFDDAIRAAAHDTPSGGVLMLSPAAPSFGRFRDYKDRSARFRALLGLT